ncbi:MAG: GNAT family N-acetyltransferase [Gammaproteobacteria bacterium]|nr:MAG: GNAT family N-acetyltransferase [Gammaproteobacteria bacterium]
MSGPGFRVLRAGVEHIELLAPLFDAYRQFYQQTSDSAAAEEFLRARLANDESVVFLAQDDDGNAIGFTQLYPAFSSVRLRSMWILNDLYVTPSARRQGVAVALMHQARQHAIETAAGGLELQTGEDNAAAQALYRDEGWKLEEGYLHFFLDVD